MRYPGGQMARRSRSRTQVQDEVEESSDPVEESSDLEQEAVADPEPTPDGGGRSFRLPGVRAFIAAIIAGLLVGGLSAVMILRQEPIFLSRAVVLIDQPYKITGPSGEGVVSKLNQLRVKYALLARTPRITDGIAKRTGLPARAVGGRVNVVLPGPSLILSVEGRSDVRRNARLIANAAGEELVALVKSEMDTYKIPEEERIIMSIVAPAQAGAQIAPSRNRAITIGSVSGLLTFIAMLVLFEMVRFRRASR